MIESVVAGWGEFAVAVAGAAGAIAGLLIVAISVNIKEIIADATLPVRALATVATVVAIMLGSLLLLLPGQPPVVLGLELLAVVLVCGGFQVAAGRAMIRNGEQGPRGSMPTKVALNVVQLLPMLIGSLLVCVAQPGAVYWVAAGFLVMFVMVFVNAWVLMVEILR